MRVASTVSLIIVVREDASHSQRTAASPEKPWLGASDSATSCEIAWSSRSVGACAAWRSHSASSSGSWSSRNCCRSASRVNRPMRTAMISCWIAPPTLPSAPARVERACRQRRRVPGAGRQQRGRTVSIRDADGVRHYLATSGRSAATLSPAARFVPVKRSARWGRRAGRALATRTMASAHSAAISNGGCAGVSSRRSAFSPTGGSASTRVRGAVRIWWEEHPNACSDPSVIGAS